MNASPEGNVIFYFFGGGFWIGVIPGGIRIFFAIHDDVVIACRALPGALSVRFAWLQIFEMNGAGWKI